MIKPMDIPELEKMHDINMEIETWKQKLNNKNNIHLKHLFTIKSDTEQTQRIKEFFRHVHILYKMKSDYLSKIGDTENEKEIALLQKAHDLLTLHMKQILT